MEQLHKLFLSSHWTVHIAVRGRSTVHRYRFSLQNEPVRLRALSFAYLKVFAISLFNIDTTGEKLPASGDGLVVFFPAALFKGYIALSKANYEAKVGCLQVYLYQFSLYYMYNVKK